MLHTKCTLRRLPADRERFRKKIVQRLAFGKSLFELRRLCLELFIRESLHVRSQRFDFFYDRLDPLQFMITVCAKNFCKKTHCPFSPRILYALFGGPLSFICRLRPYRGAFCGRRHSIPPIILYDEIPCLDILSGQIPRSIIARHENENNEAVCIKAEMRQFAGSLHQNRDPETGSLQNKREGNAAASALSPYIHRSETVFFSLLHRAIPVILIMRYARKAKSGFIVSTVPR